MKKMETARFGIKILASIISFTILSIIFCQVAAAITRRGSRIISELELRSRQDIIAFEDFEENNWESHWDQVTSVATNTDKKFIFKGKASMAALAKKGEHAGGELRNWLPSDFFPDRLHIRGYFYIPKDWSMGTCGGVKLMLIHCFKKGAIHKPTEAGVKPTGYDKFAVCLNIDRKENLYFYYYHVDQRGGYGDGKRIDGILSRDKWHCLELAIKPNTKDKDGIWKRDGELICWLDGKKVGYVGGLRFRLTEDIVIRRISAPLNYWGGAGPKETPPKNQSHYIDNVVIATDYIGPIGTKAK